eukprot:8785793-Heterocapsa_arctica.AAC.1
MAEKFERCSRAKADWKMENNITLEAEVTKREVNMFTYFYREIERQRAAWIWMTEGELDYELDPPGDYRQKAERQREAATKAEEERKAAEAA